MPFRRVPFCVKVTLIGSHGGDPRNTVLHYRRSSLLPDPGSAVLSDLLQQFVNAGQVPQKLAACVAAGTTWTEVKAVDVNIPNGAYASFPLSPPINGTRAGEPMPGGENFAVIKKANVAGRGRNGRLFIPDMSESDQNDSIVTASFITAVVNLITGLALTLFPSYGTFVPVIPSPTLTNFWGITAWVFDSLMDTLRTRQKGKRRHRRR